jgi:hypothetical protein
MKIKQTFKPISLRHGQTEHFLMTKNEEVAMQIVSLLKDSGLAYDDQVKAISIARVKIQPVKTWEQVKSESKMIERPSGGIMKQKGKK